MTISLTSVKYAAFASQETQCFEAVVLLDGKRAMTVSNEGRGGCNWYRDIIPGSKKRLHEYAKTLPDVVIKDQSGDFTMQNNLDLMIDDLLDAHLRRKDMKRALAKCVVFKVQDQVGLKKVKYKWSPATRDVIIKYLEGKYRSFIILNSLPEDEAYKFWAA